MIVNNGKLKLLTAQLTYLAGLKWGLFTNNQTIIASTTFANLTEATWAGYAQVTAGTWGAAALVAGKAVTQPSAFPSFGNTSGSSQSFYGWFLLDPADTSLVAAVNVGLTSIAAGGNYPLVPSVTDDQQ